MDIIPFDEIAAGASVRLVVIQTVQYLSVSDVIIHLNCKNKQTACTTGGRQEETQVETQEETQVGRQVETQVKMR